MPSGACAWNFELRATAACCSVCAQTAAAARRCYRAQPTETGWAPHIAAAGLRTCSRAVVAFSSSLSAHMRRCSAASSSCARSAVCRSCTPMQRHWQRGARGCAREHVFAHGHVAACCVSCAAIGRRVEGRSACRAVLEVAHARSCYDACLPALAAVAPPQVEPAAPITSTHATHTMRTCTEHVPPERIAMDRGQPIDRRKTIGVLSIAAADHGQCRSVGQQYAFAAAEPTCAAPWPRIDSPISALRRAIALPISFSHLARSLSIAACPTYLFVGALQVRTTTHRVRSPYAYWQQCQASAPAVTQHRLEARRLLLSKRLQPATPRHAAAMPLSLHGRIELLNDPRQPSR